MTTLNVRRTAVATCLAASIALFAACSRDKETITDAHMGLVLVVTMSPLDTGIAVGDSLRFTVKMVGGFAGLGAKPSLAACTSSAPTVATVVISNGDCVAKGLATGNATISAMATTGVQVQSTLRVVSVPGVNRQDDSVRIDEMFE